VRLISSLRELRVLRLAELFFAQAILAALMAKFNAAGAVSPPARTPLFLCSRRSEMHFEDFSHVNFWRLRVRPEFPLAAVFMNKPSPHENQSLACWGGKILIYGRKNIEKSDWLNKYIPCKL
jgi:hypothetical protein